MVWIGHMLNNLISNAAKSLHSGTRIRLEVSDGPDRVTFAVTEHGLKTCAEDRATSIGSFPQTQATAGAISSVVSG